VDIQINVEGVTIVDTKTKAILHRYPLQKISFCADDKQDKRIFSFIAKSQSDPEKHECYVFLSDKMAEQITLTVGEAFDLAYKRYLDKNRTSLENQKQVFVLRKRIAELEAENQVLSQRLAEAIRANKATPQLSLLDTPALPSSPMPSGPPPGIVQNPVYSTPHNTQVLPTDPFLGLAPTVNSAAQINGHNTPHAVSYSPSGPAPSLAPPPCPLPTLAPPPPVAPRRNPPARANTVPAPEVNELAEKEVLEFTDHCLVTVLALFRSVEDFKICNWTIWRMSSMTTLILVRTINPRITKSMIPSVTISSTMCYDLVMRLAAHNGAHNLDAASHDRRGRLPEDYIDRC
ncbi:phosphotyrosine interaction domain protein, partial [Cooperia oncophora]